jgi:hypothetical protein
MEVQAVKRKIDKCDVVITPDVKNVSPFSLKDSKESVKAGIIAAESCIDKIKGLLVKKASNKNS